MKLADLDSQFVGAWQPRQFTRLDSVEGAQGLLFQCPSCAQGKERGSEDGRNFVVGAHYVLCWFSNPRNASTVPADVFPGPGRWSFTGDLIDAVTLSPSVNLDVHTDHNGDPHPCRWHGFVLNGDAT